MGRSLLLGFFALSGVALVATARGAGRDEPIYSLAATQSCLARLPNAIAGLPPATPPVPPAVFVHALARDDISTWGVGVSARPRTHKQLGVWYGDRTYQGIILSFFKGVPDARASLKALAWLYGGKRIRNIVATWDQPSVPKRSVRNTVFGCLRANDAAGPAVPARTPRIADLATFAGSWGGHTRGLSITSRGRGSEYADSGCCTHGYEMTFEIVSVSGTLSRATAVYRVLSFRRYLNEVRNVRVGDVGKLRLKNGIVRNLLTRDFFCSDPAWGATGACGA